MLAGLQSDNADLTSQHDELTTDNQDADRSGRRRTRSSPVRWRRSTVRGTLPSTERRADHHGHADPADRDAVLSLLDRAGATVTAQIQLTNDFTDPARADELRSLAATTLPTGVTLPEVPQAGAIAGGAARSVLIAPAGGAAPARPNRRPPSWPR